MSLIQQLQDDPLWKNRFDWRIITQAEMMPDGSIHLSSLLGDQIYIKDHKFHCISGPAVVCQNKFCEDFTPNSYNYFINGQIIPGEVVASFFDGRNLVSLSKFSFGAYIYLNNAQATTFSPNTFWDNYLKYHNIYVSAPVVAFEVQGHEKVRLVLEGGHVLYIENHKLSHPTYPIIRVGKNELKISTPEILESEFQPGDTVYNEHNADNPTLVINREVKGTRTFNAIQFTELDSRAWFKNGLLHRDSGFAIEGSLNEIHDGIHQYTLAIPDDFIIEKDILQKNVYFIYCKDKINKTEVRLDSKSQNISYIKMGSEPFEFKLAEILYSLKSGDQVWFKDNVLHSDQQLAFIASEVLSERILGSIKLDIGVSGAKFNKGKLLQAISRDSVNLIENITNRSKISEVRNIIGILKEDDNYRCFYKSNLIKCYNNVGELHANKSPAIISSSGAEYWYKQGKKHREDGPAITYSSGDGQYWLDNKYYNKLNFELEIKKRIQFNELKLDPYYSHLDWNKVLDFSKAGDNLWVKFSNGYQYWYHKGIMHREGGPAIISDTGEEYWITYGQMHNDAGPAIKTKTESKWFLNGREYSESAFQHHAFELRKKQFIEKYPGINVSWETVQDIVIEPGKVSLTYKNGDRAWWKNMILGQKISDKLKKDLMWQGLFDWNMATHIILDDFSKEVYFEVGADRYWAKYGVLHREDGPAVIESGIEKYFLNGVELTKNKFEVRKLSKDIKWKFANISWDTVDSVEQTEDGYKFIYNSGLQAWRKDGVLHRETGPAVVYNNGNTKFFFDDEELAETSWAKKVAEKLLKNSSFIKDPRIKNIERLDEPCNYRILLEDGQFIRLANGELTLFWPELPIRKISEWEESAIRIVGSQVGKMLKHIIPEALPEYSLSAQQLKAFTETEIGQQILTLAVGYSLPEGKYTTPLAKELRVQSWSGLQDIIIEGIKAGLSAEEEIIKLNVNVDSLMG